MKKLIYLVAIVSLVVLTSCEKNEDDFIKNENTEQVKSDKIGNMPGKDEFETGDEPDGRL